MLRRKLAGQKSGTLWLSCGWKANTCPLSDITWSQNSYKMSSLKCWPPHQRNCMNKEHRIPSQQLNHGPKRVTALARLVFLNCVAQTCKQLRVKLGTRETLQSCFFSEAPTFSDWRVVTISEMSFPPRHPNSHLLWSSKMSKFCSQSRINCLSLDVIRPLD